MPPYLHRLKLVMDVIQLPLHQPQLIYGMAPPTSLLVLSLTNRPGVFPVYSREHLQLYGTLKMVPYEPGIHSFP